MISSNRLKRIKLTASFRQKGLVVVLEDIHDPHNAAAVLRTCEAFGIQKMFYIFEKEKYYNPRKIGKATSSSANKWLDFEVFRSTAECLKVLKKQKFLVLATVIGKGAKSIFDLSCKKGKIALLFGNEHRGISEQATKLADLRVMIPMRGMVQSLNLSVVAGVFIYEVTRQRQKFGRRFQLSPKERIVLEKSFLSR